MSQLTTQRQMRDVRDLPFCYLCCRTFTAGDGLNHDHVPPTAIFAEADRSFPLKLRTHQACNVDWSGRDEAIGQLVGVLHKREVPPESRLAFEIAAGQGTDGTVALAMRGIPLERIIRWCVRGFHAALYREPLEASEFVVSPPLPAARIENGCVVGVESHAVIPDLVAELKRNRVTRCLDSIVCRNEECLYDCVWSQLDDGRYFCIFGLDIYDWKELGEPRLGSRGCVGCYHTRDFHVPQLATRATRLEFQVGHRWPLDPFAEE